jgi:peptidyl-prolyl cis-trans isomerase A (cyclophilin A)
MLRRLLVGGLLGLFVMSVAVAEDTQTQQAPARTGAPSRRPQRKVVVSIETSMGNIKVELYPEKAPKTVENFLKYTKDAYFKETIFHRVMPGFVIQGGGFTKEMTRRPRPTPTALESQSGPKNLRGTIAMARTSLPNSATCQFFINLKDNLSLDYNQEITAANGYAVFGKVTEGLDVVDKIAAVPTGTVGQYQNVPSTPV